MGGSQHITLRGRPWFFESGTNDLISQRQLDEAVGVLQTFEIAARCDKLLELCRGDRKAWNDAANAPQLLGEVPHEFAASRLLAETLSVLGEDRDSWREESHFV